MNVTPVISREFRVASRHRSTYTLRLLAGLIGLTMVIWFRLELQGSVPIQGSVIFNGVRLALLLGIWLFVPLIAADSISMEQRQGTLKLLFLPPLRAIDIVLAKSLIHTLRGITLLLAVFPIAILPVLLGGITWQDASRTVVLMGASLLGALAAGILASALSERWGRALTTSLILGLGIVSSAYLAIEFGLTPANHWIFRMGGATRWPP